MGREVGANDSEVRRASSSRSAGLPAAAARMTVQQVDSGVDMAESPLPRVWNGLDPLKTCRYLRRRGTVGLEPTTCRPVRFLIAVNNCPFGGRGEKKASRGSGPTTVRKAARQHAIFFNDWHAAFDAGNAGKIGLSHCEWWAACLLAGPYRGSPPRGHQDAKRCQRHTGAGAHPGMHLPPATSTVPTETVSAAMLPLPRSPW